MAKGNQYIDIDKKRKRRTGNHLKKEKRLTIMVFKNVGRVRTFKISSALLLFASIFFFFYIVGTIFIVNSYFSLHRINNKYLEKIANLNKKLYMESNNLERAREHIALLQDFLTEKEDKAEEPLPERKKEPEIVTPKVVELKDLKIKRDKPKIRVAFKVVNKQLNNEALGGYIFIFFSIKDSDKSKVWVYPETALKEGLPVNYRKGQRFLIKRFKLINDNYIVNESPSKPLVLKILIYDRDGNLILIKTADV